MDPEDRGTPSFDLVAIIDPVSKGAQKITATLIALSKVVNAKIRIFLNCVEKHSELPQKSYFRLVLEPELTFSTTGELSAGTLLYINMVLTYLSAWQFPFVELLLHKLVKAEFMRLTHRI